MEENDMFKSLQEQVEALETLVCVLVRQMPSSSKLIEIADREEIAANPGVQRLLRKAASFPGLPDPDAETVVVSEIPLD